MIMLTITTAAEPERSPLDINLNGKMVRLSSREAQVLNCLIIASAAGGASHCTTRQLFHEVWKRSDDDSASSLVSCVLTSLRKKLPCVIAHDPGCGYRLARGVALGH